MNARRENARRENARQRSAFNVARDILDGMRPADLAHVEPRAAAVRFLYVAKRRRDTRRERIARAVSLVAGAVVLVALGLMPAALFVAATN